MGIAEKRIVAEYQKESFPKWKKKLKKACGLDLRVHVDWDDIVKEGYGECYPNTIDNNFFIPLEKSVSDICHDSIGRKAFQAKIKKVTISCKRGWSSLEVTIDGDTINLDADPSYNRDDSAVEDYTALITSKLEKAL